MFNFNNGPKSAILKKGQSFLEYTMLVIIISSALVAMSTYIIRAMNARLGQ
ncbi:MAG: hypothetical protein PHX28_03180 [Candidatus Omnitrophica bacterium]|jgi:hypothetical protein|nr:hypothetical protein [Candidatus Omnitrophota bacterium]MDD3275266.1 hypothetical protein [Candidatus Omnitrophota bacterium]MDD5725134.1 hypothetical protein [Candidatus Omnitrophota bacterium]